MIGKRKEFRISHKRNTQFVDPDEIFLDAHNSPQFNQQQFEGRIEEPVRKLNIYLLSLFFILIGGIFVYQMGMLQIVHGSRFFSRSQNNSLNTKILFSNRGVIYDRNNLPIAWNTPNEDEGDGFPNRTYSDLEGLSHIVGYVQYPAKDSAGFFWRDRFVGINGIEKLYDSILRGENGRILFEANVHGEVQSQNFLDVPRDGENIHLSIDANVQDKLFSAIADVVKRSDYAGGAGAIMDIHTGELLALTSVPEFDSNVFSRGEDREVISSTLSNPKNPFLNRAVSGLYSPGSTIKPFLAMGILNEKLIDPNKKLMSSGFISIPNPYNPDEPTIFKDWKVHGLVDLRRAISISSDTYFYTLGGGYEGQKGLGILRIEKYMRMFGFGEKTDILFENEGVGTIPNPDWKKEVFDGDIWRVGDTYNTSIGQYGFQVTPLQLLRGMAAIANNGVLYRPTILKSEENSIPSGEKLELQEKDFKIVKEGLRDAVTEGTAQPLLLPFVSVSAKTGTAEIGIKKHRVHSWSTGFFPSDDPKYSFVVVLDSGPEAEHITASWPIRYLLEWMNENAPEYLE